ncbi:MAG TPA: hypothetical protein VH142_01505 [Polyangiaceae bacterium]|nr:hypothetical protein [Polyangiaceae bacterium]
MANPLVSFRKWGRRGLLSTATFLVIFALAGVSEARRWSLPSAAGHDAEAALDVRLTLSPRLDPRQWEVHLENASSFPVRLLDDPRLLWFEVTRPNSAVQGSCRLPRDLLPAVSAALRSATLRPGESLAFSIDPRFYCFGKERENLLVASAEVTAHYGFPGDARGVARGHIDAPPVATAVGNGAAVPSRDITGAPVTLDADVTRELEGNANQPTSTSGAAPLVLHMVRGSDARSERSVDATVRLTNTTPRPIAVYLRRELLSFDVLGPDGSSTCAEPGDFRHPARLGYTRLAAHRSVTLTSRLVELCPRGTFADAGVYLVRAMFETDHGGEAVGLHAFTGRLMTEHPVMVRVRRSLHLLPNHRVLPAAIPAPTPPPVHSAALPARRVNFRRVP